MAHGAAGDWGEALCIRVSISPKGNMAEEKQLFLVLGRDRKVPRVCSGGDTSHGILVKPWAVEMAPPQGTNRASQPQHMAES